MLTLALLSLGVDLRNGIVRTATELDALNAAVLSAYGSDPGAITTFQLPTENVYIPGRDWVPTYSSWPMSFRTWNCTVSSTCDKGAVTISVGNSEQSWLYVNVAKDLIAAGYGPIHAMSHRCYGENGPCYASDMRKTPAFSSQTQDVVRDFEEYVRRTRAISPEKKHFLLCHSLGCLIATKFLQSAVAKELPFNALVYNSGLLWPYIPATYLTNGLPALLADLAFAAFYSKDTVATAFGESTTSRWYNTTWPMASDWAGLMVGNPLWFTLHSDYVHWNARRTVCTSSVGAEVAGCNTGSTYGYYQYMFDLCSATKHPTGGCIAPDNQMAIKMQLVGTGGAYGTDIVVDNTESAAMCNYHDGTNCLNECSITYVNNGAKHATMLDVSAVRDPVIAEIISVFDANQEVIRPPPSPNPPPSPYPPNMAPKTDDNAAIIGGIVGGVGAVLVLLALAIVAMKGKSDKVSQGVRA